MKIWEALLLLPVLAVAGLVQPDVSLADPGDPCTDRRPGLSKCIEYKDEGARGWSCKAACYVRQGRRGDGGTDAGLVYSTEPPKPSKDACKADLERQAKKGCRP